MLESPSLEVLKERTDVVCRDNKLGLVGNTGVKWVVGLDDLRA